MLNFPTKVLRMIVAAPWYGMNAAVQKYLKIRTVNQLLQNTILCKPQRTFE
jgi:hypothetical protein